MKQLKSHFILVFIFLNVFKIVYGIRDQYKASCFPGCRCNETVIECRNLGETTTELFRHIHPDIYPKLDTLIITGNNFGDLLNENIFGENLRHKKLTLVNLSNNGITSFGIQTFIGLPRVEYLYLDDNSLKEIFDDQPFKYFTSLKLLSMKQLFSNNISKKGRADLIRKLLQNDNFFIDLKEIILIKNQIFYLHEDTFCDVKGLTQLYLSHNQLKSFNFNQSCLSSLHMLDLANNYINTISSSLWNNLPLLDTIDFSKNPLICNCELEEFHKFAFKESNAFLNQQSTLCAKPNIFANRNFFEIDESINFCHYGSRNYEYWLVLLLIIIGAILCDRISRGHLHLIRKKFFKLKSPLISDGYSQLKSNDEVPAPVFV